MGDMQIFECEYKMKTKLITVILIISATITVLLAGCKSDDPKRVYLASPFFNETELKNVEYVESILSEKGIPYYSPIRYEAKNKKGTIEWAREIFEIDKAEIDNADIVIALDYGNYGDTGTAWECGYAAGIGKQVILVHTDRDGDSNLMMFCAGTTNIYLDELAEYDFENMPVHEYEGKMY